MTPYGKVWKRVVLEHRNRSGRQYTGFDQRGCLGEIVGHVAIATQRRHLLAQQSYDHRKRRAGRMRRAQPDALRRNQQFDAEDGGKIIHMSDRRRAACAAIDT